MTPTSVAFAESPDSCAIALSHGAFARADAKDSVAFSFNGNSAYGDLGSYLVLVERDWEDDHIKGIQVVHIDGETYPPGRYQLIDGVITEVER